MHSSSASPKQKEIELSTYSSVLPTSDDSSSYESTPAAGEPSVGTVKESKTETDIQKETTSTSTLLKSAVVAGEVETVKKLFKEYKDEMKVNIPELFYLAAYHRHDEIVKVFIDKVSSDKKGVDLSPLLPAIMNDIRSKINQQFPLYEDYTFIQAATNALLMVMQYATPDQVQSTFLLAARYNLQDFMNGMIIRKYAIDVDSAFVSVIKDDKEGTAVRCLMEVRGGDQNYYEPKNGDFKNVSSFNYTLHREYYREILNDKKPYDNIKQLKMIVIFAVELYNIEYEKQGRLDYTDFGYKRSQLLLSRLKSCDSEQKVCKFIEDFLRTGQLEVEKRHNHLYGLFYKLKLGMSFYSSTTLKYILAKTLKTNFLILENEDAPLHFKALKRYIDSTIDSHKQRAHEVQQVRK